MRGHRKWDDGDIQYAAFTALIVVFFIAYAAIIGVKKSEHDAFLREHGCQLLTEANTGRQVYCGKACFRPEKVYVYECAEGTRTEVY